MEKAILLDAILNSALNIGIVAADMDFRIEYCNPIAESVFGYRSEEVLGKTVYDIHGKEKIEPEYFAHAIETARRHEEYVFILERKKETGKRYYESRVSGIWEDQTQLVGYVLTTRDITERRLIQKHLEQQAHFDSLTNIPNRILFNDRLAQALAQTRRSGHLLALLFIDLDRFKKINDTLGHDIGDLLLQEAARRLTTCVRESDTVARMGGDEFTVLVSNITKSDDAAHIAAKIIAVLSKPFFLRSNECTIGASIGISIFPTDTKESVTLLKNADIAMYKAKEQGRNNYQFYASAMNEGAMYRLTMENNLRKALDRNELILHYQPQVDINTGRIKALEASLHWEGPDIVPTTSQEFLSIAEETGLILPIGEWMLRQVCIQCALWIEEGFAPVTLAVKMLPLQFKRENIVEVVEGILQETGFDPRYLEIQLTENTVMENVNAAVNTLSKLKDLGLLLTLNDFGTGYSSLSYLKRLPINKLKIARQFVINITTDMDYAAIAKAIIALAHTLNLRVIAEGVETVEQLEFLRSVKCDEVQGPLFSLPIPGEPTRQLLIDDQHFAVYKR